MSARTKHHVVHVLLEFDEPCSSLYARKQFKGRVLPPAGTVVLTDKGAFSLAEDRPSEFKIKKVST